MFGSGSFSNLGALGRPGIVPTLVKVLDTLRNSESALMPFWVPRISRRATVLEAFWRILRCCSNLRQSQRMCSLDSRVLLLHGQELGSWELGRNEQR